MTTTTPKASDHVKALIRSFSASGEAIRGELALGVAWLCRATKLDSPGQWGNAYFRCPGCGQARDCDGHEDWSQRIIAICECEHELGIEDLVISEGWVDRL